MNELFDMRIGVGVAGFSDKEDQNYIRKKIEQILYEIRQGTEEYNNKKFGFSGKDIIIDFYSSPKFIDHTWRECINHKNNTLNLVLSGLENKEEYQKLNADTIMSFGHKDKMLGTIQSMTEWMINKVDLLILLWTGDEQEQGGLLWNIVKESMNHKLPCIWVNPKEEDKVYVCVDSYYETYTCQKLKEYLKDIFYINRQELPEENKTFGSSVWKKTYQKFMKKWRMKQKNAYQSKDILIEGESSIFEENSEYEANYKRLLKYYHNYDEEAIRYSGIYKESIYFRSILPMAASFFLSFGFYIDTVFGYVVHPMIFGISIWTIVSGLFFLIHAAINCYGYYMANHTVLQKQTKHFLQCRYIAEYLRTMIHFYSFGMPVKINQRNLQKYGSHKQVSKETTAKIHHILHSQKPVSLTYQQETAHQVTKHLVEMIDDQIQYHQNTEKKYQRITKKLNQTGKIAFWSSFIIVVLRGILQFLFVYIHIQGERNGIPTSKFILGSSNMLALLLPAWASYFSTKLTLNNFEGLSAHSREVREELIRIKKKILSLQLRTELPYEMLYPLSEEVLMNQIGELDYWYTQTSSKKVTRL